VPGRLTTVRKPDGGTWTYSFLPGGKLAEVRDPLGGVRKYLYDALGRATHEVDPLGNVTEYILDAAGAPVRKLLPTGHAQPLPEDPNAPDPTAAPLAANPAEYQFGRLIRPAHTQRPTRTELAALALPSAVASLVTWRSDPDPVAARQTKHPVKPLGGAWWPAPDRGRIFNALGKLTEQVDEQGRTRHWTYDASGNLASHRDFDGSVWQHDYGTWHLPIRVTSPIGAVTRYTYTTQEQIASCTDPGGTVSEYGYDLNGGLAEVRRHGRLRERYERDAAGNLLAKFGADGRLLLRREIGAAHLLTRRILASGEEHHLQHDTAGRPTRLATRRDSIACAHDGLGNRLSEIRDGLGVEQAFEGWMRPAEIRYFGAFTVRIARSGTTTTLTDPTGRRHVLEQPHPGIVRRHLPDGGIETSQFDHRGLCDFKHLQASDGRIWTRRYDWSGEGALRQVQDSLDGLIRHSHDRAHRQSARAARPFRRVAARGQSPGRGQWRALQP
jgi:YD repeat-containing protein